jgi:hypothetical protein
MTDRATATASLFSKALQSVSGQAAARQRIARRLLASGDPFERLVPLRLLGEALGQRLEQATWSRAPLVLFMDRLGGADGIRAATAVIEQIGGRWSGAALVYVSYATPQRGLGALVRASLTGTGAATGVLVDVVAHRCPADQLRLSDEDARALTAAADLVVTYAPGGVAGIGAGEHEAPPDLLLARSDLAVLSFPDPEAVVADLDGYARIIEDEPGLDALRFWVQARTEGGIADLGHAVLGPDGDARERLWVLLDNARRLRYRVLIDPLCDGLPAGTPLVCPCRTLIEEQLAARVAIERVVAAGNRLVVVARATETRG